MLFFQIAPENIGGVWGHIRSWIVKGVEKSSGRLTEGSVFDRAEQGLFQVWAAWDGKECRAVIVTSLETHPSGMRALNGVILAGLDHEEWADLAIETLEKFARIEGCGIMDCFVRSGFDRVFAKRGYRKSHHLWELTLG